MFLKVQSKLPARLLASVALASFGAVAAALIAQHGYGVRPCAWCVLQRGIFLLVGATALLGWLGSGAKPLRRLALVLVLLLAVAGAAAAIYQHEVANHLESCDMTLADRIVQALDLETRLPKVFMITAPCADAAGYRLLGLAYEIWSALLFTAIALGALLGLRKN